MGLKELFKEGSNKSDRLQESLEEVQGRYRKLLNHTQAIQYTHDLQGQFLSVDREITEFLGYDRNSLLNMNICALLASEVRHKFETYLAEIKRQGVAKGLMVVQTASGEKRILKYYNTLRTEGVPIPFVQGIAYDVTEQKQTKKALAELSEQLSIVLKSLPIVCYIGKAEEDYGATYITHNVKAITGFEQTDFTSKSSFWANRVHPEDAPKIFADLPQIFEKGYHEHQYRWQVADGSYKWFYGYTRLMKSSDGKNYVIGMMQDITERKRAEEALLHAAQQWRTTFDGINDFVSLLDLDGKILRCNKAVKDFVGKPFDEIINHSCWEIILGTATPIEDCPFLRMKETLHRETTILSVNNLWFNVSVDPIFDQASRLIGAVNIISDITKRKQAEEAVTRLSQQNAIMAEIGRIISSTLNIDEVYERFSQEVRKLIPFDRIEIITINPQDYTITIAYITGIDVPARNAGDTIPMSGTVVQDVFRTRSSQLIQPHNIEELARRFPPLLSSFQAGLRSMIFVPLFSEDQVIGALSLKTTKPDFYTERDLRLTERVGNQIAGAIANAQLFIDRKRAQESAARFSQENAIMAEIGRVISSTLNIDEVYERFAQELRELIPIDRVSLTTINPDGRSATITYSWGPDIKTRKKGDVFPLKGTLVEMASTRRSGILVEAGDEETFVQTYPTLLNSFRAGFRSFMSVPLISKDEVIGALILHAFKEKVYTEQDLQLAERVGNQIAGAIANSQLFIERKRAEEAAARLAQENAGVAEIGRIVSSTLNIEEVYERFAEEVRKLIPFDRISVGLIHYEKNTTSVAYGSGGYVQGREVGDEFPLAGSAAEWVTKTRSGLLVQTEIEAEVARIPGLIRFFQVGYRSMIVVPLISKDIVIGVLFWGSTRPNSYTDYHLKLAENIGNQIAGAIANSQLYAERKRVEDTLRRSEERYRNISENIKEGYYEVDLAGNFTFLNNMISKQLGYSAEELIGMNYRQYTDEKTARELYQIYNTVYSTGELSKGLDIHFIIKDGTKRFFEIIASLIKDSEGKPIGFRGVSWDVTERKQAEEALQRSEEGAKRLAQENATVAEIGRIISSTLNIEDVYERFVGEVRKFIPFERITINNINPKENTFVVHYNAGLDMADREVGKPVPLTGTATEWVMQNRSTLLILEENREEMLGRIPGLLPILKAGFHSVMLIPLISKDQVIGTLALQTAKPNAYTEVDMRLAERISNQIAGAIANAQLFIERKQAEEALLTEKQRFQTVSENAAFGMVMIDKTGTYKYINPKFKELFGYDLNDIPDGKTWYRKAFPDPTYRNHAISVWINDKRLGSSKPGEKITRTFTVTCKDGTEKIIDFLPVKLETGEYLMSYVDITLRKKAEDALQRSEEAATRLAQENATVAEIGRIISSTLNIEEVYERFAEEVRKLISFDRISINIVNPDNNTASTIYVLGIDVPGRRMGDITPFKGTAVSECIRTRSSMLIQPENVDEYLTRFPALLPTFQAGLKSIMYVPLISKDQVIGALSLRTTKSNAYTDRDVRLAENIGNQIAGAIANAQLFTEHERSEKEKVALQEQLRQSQKMEAIGQLAGGVAHDFNNLLTVIHGYSELMLNNLDQESRLRQDVQEVINASERASSLTRQLLAFSRKQVLQPKVLDLNTHVSNMDRMLRRMIGEDVELVTLLTKDLGRIKADPGQIEQVILNLAVNAKDAMLNGGKLTIETANVKLDENYARSRIGVTPGDYVMLSMSDTGVGMAPETKDRIFEPFFTTKEKGKGTGLGLSTVYGIVQQSGGNIWVYSEPGLGTTFKIYLPRIEEGTESHRPAAVSTKPLQGSETVLLVEDEEMVRKLACMVLEKNGYRVLEASNGNEALDVVQGRNGNPIHLVVTDVVMPGMSGRQLADRLVSLRPEIKILYMSGYTDNAIVHHGVLDPGIAYIQKPFTPDALASKVREILDGN